MEIWSKMEIEKIAKFRVFVEDIKNGKYRGLTVYENESLKSIDLEKFFRTLRLLIKKFEVEKK